MAPVGLVFHRDFDRVWDEAAKSARPTHRHPVGIEAAQVMGASTSQIVRKVLLPEAMSPLVAGATLTLVMLIGYSAMAGTIGGGGVGDFAIRYGYQTYEEEIMYLTILIMIVLVMLVQLLGSTIARGLDRRRR